MRENWFRWSGTTNETPKPKACHNLEAAGTLVSLKFAAEHMDKEFPFYRKVLQSDETQIELLGHNDQMYV